jgi:uncharacterized protein
LRWKGNRQSNNIEDLRGLGGLRGGGSLGGGGGILRILFIIFRIFGIKGTAVAVVGLVGYGLYTGNLNQLLSGGSFQNNTQKVSNKPVKQSAAEKETVEFISVVLADTEDTWKKLFQQKGAKYQEPRLVLFRQSVKSRCGIGSADMGPFYCPADKKVYIDLSFYDDLKHRYKAPGDFAQAYVIAHEIGHHVQNLVGTSGKVHQAKSKLNKVKANQLSVKLELQADCYAGIWAHHANRSRQILETGDIEEGLKAASAIGDDKLQKQAQGYVQPDSFTHGSSKQRVKWFKTGLEKGTFKDCQTFSSKTL